MMKHLLSSIIVDYYYHGLLASTTALCSARIFPGVSIFLKSTTDYLDNS